jgi:inorganic pyrophosphatase
MGHAMENISSGEGFFALLERLVEESGVTIDRPKGYAHPRYPDRIYPIDYGYINGTQSQDGQGIDLFWGDDDSVGIVGVLCTVDGIKKDAEIKILYHCTEENIRIALGMVNHDSMRAILVRRRPIASALHPARI